jgi:hypothetical protein
MGSAGPDDVPPAVEEDPLHAVETPQAVSTDTARETEALSSIIAPDMDAEEGAAHHACGTECSSVRSPALCGISRLQSVWIEVGHTTRAVLDAACKVSSIMHCY